jgi:lipoyl-dependent peroxiredoxin
MPARKANAVWNGTLKEGNGTMRLGTGAFEGKYSFSSRFEEGAGTNPEELIAAAHAGCFSMALSAGLEKAGFPAERVETTATVHLAKDDTGFGIGRIELKCEAKVPNISDADFQKAAEDAKKGCPISKALAAVKEIQLDAKLV